MYEIEFSDHIVPQAADAAASRTITKSPEEWAAAAAGQAGAGVCPRCGCQAFPRGKCLACHGGGVERRESVEELLQRARRTLEGLGRG